MALSINTTRISPNRSVRRSKIRRIVIHHWDDPKRKPSLAGVVSWLTSTRSRVSAHYVVSERQVYRLVPESVVAWHAAGGNSDSIGIELDPRQQDSTYETAAALIRDIRSRHGDIPLVRHRDVKGSYTSCPGTYDLGRLDRLARGVNPAPATAKPKGAGKLTVDGRMGRDTVRALQRFLNSRVKSRTLTVDGRAGESTWRSLQEYLHAPHVDGKISRQSHAAESLGNGVVPSTWEHTGPRSKGSQTVRLLQKWVGVGQDGIWGEGTTRALQQKLNTHAVGM